VAENSRGSSLKVRLLVGGSKPQSNFLVTSGTRQKFCRNFLTMADFVQPQVGVRITPVFRLDLC
jgi:hypothetical protein